MQPPGPSEAAAASSRSLRFLRVLLVVVWFVATAAALTALDARATRNARLTADEPQYLLTAISLGEDLDLDIADEIAGERYRPFHGVRIDQQTIVLDESGQQLSPHDPLLPALLAVPMRLGGWAAAKATLAGVAGVAAALCTWVAVRRFGVGEGIAAAVVTAFFVSPPLVSYGTQVYPEMPAALAALAGLAAVTGPVRRRALVGAGMAVVALPWLAVKYVPVATVIAATAGARAWRAQDRRGALAFAACLTAAGVVYLAAHQLVYGGWTVYASGDHFVDGEFLVVGSDPDYWARSRRAIGLLVDRGFGLIPWAPAYLALVPAVAWVVRRRIAGWLPLVGILAACWATATWVALTMHGWWWPGRQLVVGLPAGVIAVAVLAQHARVWLRVTVLGGLVGAVTWVWLAVEASTGRRTMIVDFEQTLAPAYRVLRPLFPDHRQWSTGTVLITAAWAMGLGILAVLSIRRPAGSAGSARHPVALRRVSAGADA